MSQPAERDLVQQRIYVTATFHRFEKVNDEKLCIYV